jgi:hypothetical protein
MASAKTTPKFDVPEDDPYADAGDNRRRFMYDPTWSWRDYTGQEPEHLEGAPKS